MALLDNTPGSKAVSPLSGGTSVDPSGLNVLPVLVVDLDDTLVKTDLLYESAFAFLKKSPFHVFTMAYWLLTAGLAGFKQKLAQEVQPKAQLLPYRQSVIDLIKAHRARAGHPGPKVNGGPGALATVKGGEELSGGVQIGLVSASPHKWVLSVADHLGLFDFVMGSSEQNLKGDRKYKAIQERLGLGKFTYVGDAKADLAIWRQCGSAIAVNAPSGVVEELKKQDILVAEIKDKASSIKPLIKQLRVHQWAKNALLFLPLLASHQLSQGGLLQTLLAMVAFSLAASAVYVINDLIDIESDRNHHSKKNRPLANGTLSVQNAIGLFFALLLGSVVVGLAVNAAVVAVIGGYYLLNVLYTFYFKKEVILDIILLSSMYTIRLFAGAVATGVPISDWLLAFSTFFFFSLACVKRCTEMARSQSKPMLDGRGYYGSDYGMVTSIGVATGLISTLVILLYIHSQDVRVLYGDKQFLWLLMPVLVYWLGRVWLLTGRGQIHDDPVVFAIKDRISWLCAAAMAALLIISK